LQAKSIRINDLVCTHTPIYIFIAATDRFIRAGIPFLLAALALSLFSKKSDAPQSAQYQLSRNVFASCSALETLERVVKLSIDVLSALVNVLRYVIFSARFSACLFLFQASNSLMGKWRQKTERREL
jgi:hypothetical protein